MACAIFVPIYGPVFFGAFFPASSPSRCRFIYLACFCVVIFSYYFQAKTWLAAEPCCRAWQFWGLANFASRHASVQSYSTSACSGWRLLCRRKPHDPSLLCTGKSLYALDGLFWDDRTYRVSMGVGA